MVWYSPPVRRHFRHRITEGEAFDGDVTADRPDEFTALGFKKSGFQRAATLPERRVSGGNPESSVAKPRQVKRLEEGIMI